jgi:hypothetical protein
MKNIRRAICTAALLAVSIAFQSFGPVGQMMNFVQQQDRSPALSACFRVRPATPAKNPAIRRPAHRQQRRWRRLRTGRRS